jgi:4-alpha-glucanotransferase
MTETPVQKLKTTTRTVGVLLHPTSLPGRFGIGDLGDELLAFLDWAKSAGIRMWQVLPLNAPGYGNSPYGCLSSYAGNPMLISPQRLVENGLLPDDALHDVPPFAEDYVEFDRVHRFKSALLRQSFAYFEEHASDEQRQALAAFIHDNAWLPDWTLYAALKEQHGGAAWTSWTADVAARDRDALAAARVDLDEESRFHEYVQWLFFAQWAAVREAADARGIRIMGDVPIYVAGDSADVWANREIFQLDERGEPQVVAGVPPDYFSVTGQRWGNPLYRWDVLRATHFGSPTSSASITSAVLPRIGRSPRASAPPFMAAGCPAPAARCSMRFATRSAICRSSPKTLGTSRRKCMTCGKRSTFRA